MKKLILIIMFLAAEVAAYDFSGIDIINIVGDFSGNHYDAIHTSLWVVSDDLDEWDMVIGNNFCYCVPDMPYYICEVGSMYSLVGSHKCLYDYRPCDSNVPFVIKLFLCGTVGNVENHLLVDYYVNDQNETFDDKMIILESDRLLYGKAVDVRKVIEIGCPYGGGIIPLKPVPAGQYGIANPYGEMTLSISARNLTDINVDGITNLKDFVYLVDDWQKPQGKYKGDITGVAGVPDGFVDFYDLQKMAHGWLR